MYNRKKIKITTPQWEKEKKLSDFFQNQEKEYEENIDRMFDANGVGRKRRKK